MGVLSCVNAYVGHKAGGCVCVCVYEMQGKYNIKEGDLYSGDKNCGVFIGVCEQR